MDDFLFVPSVAKALLGHSFCIKAQRVSSDMLFGEKGVFCIEPSSRRLDDVVLHMALSSDTELHRFRVEALLGSIKHPVFRMLHAHDMYRMVMVFYAHEPVTSTDSTCIDIQISDH